MSRPQNLEARGRILDAAYALFHERGFRGVSMDDVAGKAGVKKPNLFHYYPTKDELAQAVLDRAIACCRDGIVCRLADAGDPIRIVEGMFGDSIAGMSKNGCCKGCFIGNLAAEVSDQNEKLRKSVSEYLRFWSDQLAAFLRRHRAEGVFRKDMDPKQSAEAIISLLEGATLFSKASKRVDALVHARKMAALYLKSFKV